MTSSPVVPQLEDSVVEGGEDPGPVDVEGQTLHPGGLGLELSQHPDSFSISAYNSIGTLF